MIPRRTTMVPTLVKEATALHGLAEHTSHMVGHVSPEERVRATHPLRAIRVMTAVFATLSPRFTKPYSNIRSGVDPI